MISLERPRGESSRESSREDSGRVVAALHRLAVEAVRHRPRDMSLTSLSTLCLIEATGPRRITDLAVLEGVAQPSMTAMIGGLEAAGLVERRRDPCDGRAVLVEISELGRAAVCRRRSSGTETLSELIAKLPEDESALLCQAAPALEHLCDLFAGARL